jgi:hypothetical protein
METDMIRHAIAAAGLALLTAAPALADRGPNPEELQKITAALKAAGYVSWEEVGLDDDGPFWEIDDARKGDGSRWDLKLRPNTLGIHKAERED